MAVPQIQLNDNHSIPQLGFGVFKVDPGVTQGVVEAALAAGYRHIDTATGYSNEAAVGAAVRASDLPRDQLFVTTKLANADHRAGDFRGAYERSLAALDLDYIDLYLIHWPMPAVEKYVAAWQEFIHFRDEGLTKSIGVSNFQIEHLDAIIAATGVVPAVNQVELHPVFQERDLRAYHDAHGIVTEAWGPLGQGRWALDSYPAIAAAAAAHGKSPAQVILRWHIQHGTVIFPKASAPAHMADNFAIFDFELAPAELAAIDALDTNQRLGGNPYTNN